MKKSENSKKETVAKPAKAPVKTNTGNKTAAINVKKTVAKTDAPVKTSALSSLNTKNTDTVEKGAKAVSNKSKRDVVKVNAQKAEAKKFATMKNEAATAAPTALRCKCGCRLWATFLGTVKSGWNTWFGTYKSIFTYSTRTSRLEFWKFMMINIIPVGIITVFFMGSTYDAILTKHKMSTWVFTLYMLFYLLEILVYVPLFVRRLHDAGRSSRTGFFKPLIITGLLTLIATHLGVYMMPDDGIIPEGKEGGYIFYGFVLLLIMISFFYYSAKTFIACGMLESDTKETKYGTPVIYDECCTNKTIRYATLYFIFMAMFSATLDMLDRTFRALINVAG